MTEFLTQMLNILKLLVEKEFKTEIGRVNAILCILLSLVIIIFLQNDYYAPEMTPKTIFIMIIILIITFIICMIFVYKMEKSIIAENKKNTISKKIDK